MKRSTLYDKLIIFFIGTEFGGILAGNTAVFNYAIICVFLCIGLWSIANHDEERKNERL